MKLDRVKILAILSRSRKHFESLLVEGSAETVVIAYH